MNLQKKNYDSAFCGSLPLHHLNVIQPHGALLVLDRQNKLIVQASENIAGLLGLAAFDVVDTPLERYLDDAGKDLLNERLNKEAGG